MGHTLYLVDTLGAKTITAEQSWGTVGTDEWSTETKTVRLDHWSSDSHGWGGVSLGGHNGGHWSGIGLLGSVGGGSDDWGGNGHWGNGVRRDQWSTEAVGTDQWGAVWDSGGNAEEGSEDDLQRS